MSIMSYNGGSVIAMTGKDCVCIGSDLRLGEQMLTIAVNEKKVHKISDRIYVGLSGFRSDTETVLNRLKFRKTLYELRESRSMKPKVVGTLLSNLLYERRFGPYFIEPIVAGLDPVTYKPVILGMDLIGCTTTPRDFVAAGTAEEQMLGSCEAYWREDMSADEVFEATAQALLSAMEREAGSSCGAVIYTITKEKVNVKTIKGRLD